MKIIADYHTHTIYSDGKGTIEQNVITAINRNLDIVGISDHGHKHMGFGVKYHLFEKMRYEVDLMNEKYPFIKVMLGVEANILDDKGNIDIDDKIMKYFDYIMAGYHFASRPTNWIRGSRNHFSNYTKLFNNYEVKYNTNALINAMKNNDIFILTHPGDKGHVNIIDVAHAAVETGTLMEINSLHKNLTLDQLLAIKHTNANYVIGSDSHIPENVGNFDSAIERVKAAEIDLEKIVNIRGD